MKKQSLRLMGLSALTAAAITFGYGAIANAQPAATSSLGIILVDRNAFFSESTAGQDVLRQAQDLQKQMQTELQGRADKLRIEEEQLVGQQAVLTQEAFQAKAQKLTEDRQQLQREADQRGRQLQDSVLKAQNQIWQATSPILDAILKERKAVLMIDRSAVVKGSVDLDVTAMALQRLNKTLPQVKVALTQTTVAPSPPKPASQTPAAGTKPPQGTPGR